MKRKAVFTLLGSIAALLAALLFALQAAQLWQERAELLAQGQKQQQLLGQSKAFAKEHADYAAFFAREQQRLALLERRYSAQRDVNKALQRLQGLAAAQGLSLTSVELLAQAAPKADAQTERLAQPVRLTAKGDFFQLLRWLRQVERAGFAAEGMQMKLIDDGGMLQLELNTTLNQANL